MSTRASGIILYVTLIGGILSLPGEGGPDRDIGGGRGLPQPQASLRDISAPAASPGEARVRQNLSYGNIPLYFVPNKGQVNKAAQFYARASRYTLWLTAEGLVFDRSVGNEKPSDRTKPWEKELAMGRGEEMPGGSQDTSAMDAEGRHSEPMREKAPAAEARPGESSKEAMRPERRLADVLPQQDRRGENIREVHRLVFMGANPEPKLEGEGRTGHTANYFIGSDPAKWRTDIATSRAAVYRALYPNIDLKVYGVEKQIEYDWLVKPGGDPGAIDFAYQDVLGTEIDADGDLIIRTELGEFRHRKPVAYQQTASGTRESVAASFRKMGTDRYGFSVGDYDLSRALIIDPVVLIYSVFLGGSTIDQGYAIAVDDSSCAYVTGVTNSFDFPTMNPFQPNIRDIYDAFVTKLSASGDALIYSTYLGGSTFDFGYGIAIDSLGNAYITGRTTSPDFPIRNPIQENFRGVDDAFVAKLSSGGNELIYATYLGGSGGDVGYGIAVDNAGCAFIVGSTTSLEFPLQNPFQGYKQFAEDVFVTKLSAEGNTLVYSTYLGGGGYERGRGICVDSSGCAYITGETSSSDFPVQNPFQADQHLSYDAFVTKFSASGTNLVYSTYLGGSREDHGSGISIDISGCAYVTGRTDSTDFPTQNPFQGNLLGNVNAFVTKLLPAGNNLAYSTFFGGSGGEEAACIAVDNLGCAYIAGWTASVDFPVKNPFQANLNGWRDCFVAKVEASGDNLAYSTFLGGTWEEEGYGIAVDRAGCAYITGESQSTDFPAQNPFHSQGQGYLDAFVTKLDMTYMVAAAVLGVGGSVSPATQTVVPGESASVNIYPDIGYGIASITDNGGSVDVANPYVINNVREDHDVVVTFARVYTIAASVSGVGGSVNPPTQTVMAGGTATIDIYPDLGYHIGSIKDNGASVAIASPYVITNVQEDHSVVVTFANAPPTIKIINPTNGAKVYGVVTVKAEASDDLRVLKVAFLIDEQLIGEDAFAESTSLYTQAWDTRGYAFGTHKIKAVAFDEAGLTAEEAINVIVENVALTLQGQRLTESAWILKKQFIQLTISIQNLGQVSVAKYVIYRKNGTGDFKAIKEIPGSEVIGPTYVSVDKAINKNQTYTYRVLALGGSGVALGVSNDITL